MSEGRQAGIRTELKVMNHDTCNKGERVGGERRWPLEKIESEAGINTGEESGIYIGKLCGPGKGLAVLPTLHNTDFQKKSVNGME